MSELDVHPAALRSDRLNVREELTEKNLVFTSFEGFFGAYAFEVLETPHGREKSKVLLYT